MNIGIGQNDLQQIIAIFKSNPKISELILFGSRAKGVFNNGSDIDLCIKGSLLELNDILELKVDIDELLLPYQFDIIIYHRIKEKALIDHIDRVGIKGTSIN